MKLEVTYTDATKVQIELADKVILALADQAIKAKATDIAAKVEEKRGDPLSVKVV